MWTVAGSRSTWEKPHKLSPEASSCNPAAHCSTVLHKLLFPLLLLPVLACFITSTVLKCFSVLRGKLKRSKLCSSAALASCGGFKSCRRTQHSQCSCNFKYTIYCKLPVTQCFSRHFIFFSLVPSLHCYCDFRFTFISQTANKPELITYTFVPAGAVVCCTSVLNVQLVYETFKHHLELGNEANRRILRKEWRQK